MLKEYSILIGGKAGDGIRQTGANIAALLNELGYWIFVYEVYPSIIRGGHNFSIIRAASEKILAHVDQIDILVALDQETITQHSKRLKKDSLIIFDSSCVKAEGLGFDFVALAKKFSLPPIARNTGIFALLSFIIGADFSTLEKVIRYSLSKKTDENVLIARASYELITKDDKKYSISKLNNLPVKLMTGNEALALGAVKGGLEFFSAYPMTPTTTILNYFAENHRELNLKVIQAENEIAVIGMAEGAAYAGKRAMVATSGGGFSLMVEHLSLAGQAEIPIVIILGQRPGPATGLPTHSGQGELLFAIHAGHGEFPRIVVAPGDAEEAIEITRDALNLAWQFQIPVIVLGDKHLCESIYSVEPDKIVRQVIAPKLWDRNGEYKRYLLSEDGVSALAFPGEQEVIVRVNSYEHDESGTTSELSQVTINNVEKRINKEASIELSLENHSRIKVYGDKKSKTVLIVWGSTSGSTIELASRLKCRVIQVIYLHPLPIKELLVALKDAKKIIGVECNAGGQLCSLIEAAGFKIDAKVLKYDGRPFTVNELEEKLLKIL